MDSEHILSSVVSEKGRSMELSDLVLFGERLMTVDDRTGILFEVVNGTQAIPRAILMDGDGDTDKGFKGEWMTVKDGLLYIGGMGKEWTDNNGKILNTNPCFVKVVDGLFGVTHLDWTPVYAKLRVATGHTNPGYMIHEAVHWCPLTRRWMFLPRRASKLSYNDVEDEERAANLLITATEDFAGISSKTLGPLEKSKGFASFKPVPDRPGDIIAIKTEELKGEIHSYLVGYNLETGAQILPTTDLGTIKFEGIEFLTS